MASPTSRARCGVSANAIFTPREMKQYRRWQNLHTTLRPSEQGFMPTADEYEDFQQWLRKQDSGYFSDIFEDVAEHIKPSSAEDPPTAILCRHTMHPITSGQLRRRCPVCMIDMYIGYTRALEKALRDAGGRPPSCTLTATPYQESLYHVWITGKLQTLQQLSELEKLAEDEAVWSAQHPEARSEDVRTASQALDLYWSEVGVHTKLQKQQPKKGKTVNFASGTEFDVRRPSEYYWRRSPRYQPGRYTLCEQDEEEDVVSEDSEDYSHAPVLLGQGPSQSDSNVVNVYDYTQTRIILNDMFRCSGTGTLKPEDALAEITEDEDEMLDDDDDSDWEDMDNDDETDEGDFIYFEVEEESNFVVFAED
jgi:hypothetical protein